MMKNRHSRFRMAGLLPTTALVAAGLCCGCSQQTATARADSSPEAAPAAQQRQFTVVLSHVASRTFEDRVVVQGNLQAKNTVTVPALLPGTLEEIYVDEGDEVVAGETKLFKTDDLKVRKAVEIATQDLAVARCGLREKQANHERVKADLEKAEIDLHRFEQLYADEVVSLDVLEQQQSRFKQTNAVYKHALTLVDLGEEQLRQAQAALVIAEKNLKDALIIAPLSGSINMRFAEPGEMRGAGDPIVRIEDRSVIEASAFLPAQYYPRITAGKTKVRVTAYGIDAGEHTITYKTPTINPKLRTFEVKCVFTDPPEGVVPGAMADMVVLLEQREGPGIPAGAVQTRDGKSVVFSVENDLAKMLEIETGLETDGWVEVVGGALPEGAPVVTMGQYLLDDGVKVTVQEERG